MEVLAEALVDAAPDRILEEDTQGDPLLGGKVLRLFSAAHREGLRSSS
jgi:hypothetical protein